MRILSVASECFPLVKTGGLADVVGALPSALAPLGCEVKVLIPAYPLVIDRLPDAHLVANYPDLFGGAGRLLAARLEDGTEMLALDAPHLYARAGGIYTGPDGNDWPDNPVRFAALSAVAAAIGLRGVGGWKPEIVHAHDWQAGFTPVYLSDSREPRPRTVFTIHNIAFQGLVSALDYWKLGLPWHHFQTEGVEFYGLASALKAGIVYADQITTVSPTYARELRTEAFGGGLEGVLDQRADRLTGILNGVDTGAWDPLTDPAIAAPFSLDDPSGKAASKLAVQTAFGLNPVADRLLFCVISRLTEQKGLDLVIAEAGRILARGGQLAVLGSGAPEIEAAFQTLAAHNPGSVGVRIGYDEPLSHLLQAGADAILVPSRFEPCGLTQLYALRYGTVPIVARTGGLADTVIDANDAALKAGTGTGFQFAPITAEALGFALERAFDLYESEGEWHRLRQRAMRHPVGWETSARQYVELYEQLLGR